jgi:hypothetical protein
MHPVGACCQGNVNAIVDQEFRTIFPGELPQFDGNL